MKKLLCTVSMILTLSILFEVTAFAAPGFAYDEQELIDFTPKWESIVQDETIISLTPGGMPGEIGFAWLSQKDDSPVGFRISENEDMSAYTELEVESTKAIDSLCSNKVTATNLEKGKTYYYSYTENGIWSEPEGFTIQDDDEFTVLFISDAQLGRSGDEELQEILIRDTCGWNYTVNKMTKQYPDAAFLISAGDQLQSPDSLTQMKAYLSPEPLRSLPVANTIGNHDDDATLYGDIFNNPNQVFELFGDKAGSGYYYTYGDVLFITINSNNTYLFDTARILRKATKAYPDTKWRVVTMHHNPYSAAIEEDEYTELRPLFSALYDCYDIDLCLSGHDHFYSRTEAMYGGEISENEGTVYIQSSSASGSNYDPLPETLPSYTVSAFDVRVPTYTAFNFTDDALTGTTYRTDTDEVIDTFTIEDNTTDSRANLFTYVFSIFRTLFSMIQKGDFMITKEQWKSIRGSSPRPDQIMLSIKGDASSSMTVRWRTDTTVKEGYALCRKIGDSDWQKFEAEHITFETDMDESNFFFADMTGLESGTKYEYTCGSDADRSETYTFRTADENCEKFSFLCMSDVQTGDAEPPADYTLLGEILKKVLKDNPCDFILTAGDNTNCGQTDIQWTGLFEGLKGICESVPVMFCMGNHDDMGFSSYFTKEDKYYSEHATYFTNQLWGSYAHNGPEGWIVVNHAFDYGNAHFCLTGTSGYEEMNQWLIEQGEKSDKTWKFAAHHFPVCYSGPAIECDDTYPSMRDGMEKFDIVFSGHEHSFARSYPRRKDGLYDKPSQGTIHYNIGSGNRNPPGTRVVDKVWNAKTYCHEEDLSMFTKVDIDKNKCTLTAFVEDGRTVDYCVVDKDKDLITPIDPAPVYNRPRLKFKGYDLGICTEETLPQNVDGVWYVPIGQIINFIGGDVERTKGKIKIGVYGRTCEFTENSDTVITESGEYKMEAPCLRLRSEQLYAPVKGFCEHIRMTPYYFEHNNFITIESNTEARPIPHQP